MCGRFTLHTPGDALAEAFGLDQAPQLSPRFNIAPSQDIAVVRPAAGGHRELVLLRWGLVPSWAKDATIGARLINARAETVAEKPSFRAAFRRRRCLLPADGFYEWAKLGDKKQPYYFRRLDGAVFAFAGLWEHWTDPDGRRMESCTLLTAEANRVVAPIHERMPVMLDAGSYGAWLDPDVQTPDPLIPLLRPYAEQEMTGYPVRPVVNRPENDGPQCILPLEDDLILNFEF